MTATLTPIRPALPSFTVSGAELRVLVAVARHADGDPSFEGVDPALVDGLVARGLLHRTADVLHLPDGPLGGAIEVVAASHLQLQVRHVAKPAPSSSWFALTPIVGVELHEEADGSWAVDAFPTRDVFVRIAGLVRLDDREPAAVDPFETTGAALEQCADHLAVGDRLAAEDDLRSAGATELAARAFLGAFERRVATNAVVQSVPLASGSRTQVFAWFDSEDWGLWRVPLPDPTSNDPVLVGSLTAFAICTALAQLLPLADDPGWHDVILPFPPPGT